jgi:hypothetical protein
MFKQNVILKIQQETRRKCYMNLCKFRRIRDVPNTIFADECYIRVSKDFDYQKKSFCGYSLELIRDESLCQLSNTAVYEMVSGGVFSGGRSSLVVFNYRFLLNLQTCTNRQGLLFNPFGKAPSL